MGGAAPSDLHRPLDLTRIKYIPKHTGVVPSGKTPGFRTWLLDQIWGILVTAARELGLAGLILVFCHMLPSLNHKTLPLLLQNKDDSQVPPCPASPGYSNVRRRCAPALPCPLPPHCSGTRPSFSHSLGVKGACPSQPPTGCRKPPRAAPPCPLGARSRSCGIASCTPLDCLRHMGKDSAVCLGYTFIDSLLSSFTAP